MLLASESLSGLLCVAVIVNVICGPIAAGIAARREAGLTGLMLGLFFGPLGIIAAGFLDERQACPHCGNAVNNNFATCAACHGAVHWVEGRPYNASGAEDREFELAVATEHRRAQELKAAARSQAIVKAAAQMFRDAVPALRSFSARYFAAVHATRAKTPAMYWLLLVAHAAAVLILLAGLGNLLVSGCSARPATAVAIEKAPPRKNTAPITQPAPAPLTPRAIADKVKLIEACYRAVPTLTYISGGVNEGVVKYQSGRGVLKIYFAGAGVYQVDLEISLARDGRPATKADSVEFLALAQVIADHVVPGWWGDTGIDWLIQAMERTIARHETFSSAVAAGVDIRFAGSIPGQYQQLTFVGAPEKK